MSKNAKISVALVVAALIAVLAIANAGRGNSTAPAAATASDRLVRPDSQRLSTADDGKVTFVEFLDYECEACAAAYPASISSNPTGTSPTLDIKPRVNDQSQVGASGAPPYTRSTRTSRSVRWRRYRTHTRRYGVLVARTSTSRGHAL